MFACERSARSSWLQDRLAPVNLNNYHLKEVEKYLRSKYINQTYRKTSHTTWTLNIKIRVDLDPGTKKNRDRLAYKIIKIYLFF